MKLIDSHAHLDNEQFNEDREEVLNRIKENLDFAVNIGYDLASSKKSVEFAKNYDFIYAVVGVHPDDIGEYSDEVERELEKLAQEDKVLAIGEIGLDYHWMTFPKEQQQEVFRKQMKLAQRVGKPVAIHSREAMEDTLKILKEFPDVKGIFHCYPGSVETGGVLTFKNAKKLVEVVENIPLDKLIIETDCPYMAPTPYRGKRNEPVYVEYVARKIAEIKGISYEEVVEVTNRNTRKAYEME